MRAVLALGSVAVLGALTLAGCGSDVPLPTETRIGRTYSTDNSYQMVATWTGMDGIADILLTQGPGTQLFLLFRRDGAGPASRGEVFSYALKARPPVPAPLPGIEFRSLFVPTALAAGGSRLFVLDEGDTALARDPLTGRVGNLALTWRVREFGLLGGDTISTFTDTSMAFVRGIAADDQGRVYVSGSAIVLIPDQQDPRIRTRTFQFRVYRYRRANPGEPPDPFMPGAGLWRRDVAFQVEEGSGIGTLSDPRGLDWLGPAVPGGPALFAADFGKNWVQKLSDAVSSTGFFKIEADSAASLDGPLDVAADRMGYVYVADSGNQRVLRFDGTGEFVQRVDVEPDADGQSLQDPVAIAADDSLVYVADRVAGKVIRYQRRR